MDNNYYIARYNELSWSDTLYRVAKVIAEADSIGECYGYCDNYTKEMFHIEVSWLHKTDNEADYDSYLKCAIRVFDTITVREHKLNY